MVAGHGVRAIENQARKQNRVATGCPQLLFLVTDFLQLYSTIQLTIHSALTSVSPFKIEYISRLSHSSCQSLQGLTVENLFPGTHRGVLSQSHPLNTNDQNWP